MQYTVLLQLLGPILLEPIQKVFISTPQDLMGDASRELNQRRAQVKDMQTEKDMVNIDAKAPVAEMFGFASAIDQLLAEECYGNTENMGFEPLPKQLQTEVVKQIRERKGLNQSHIQLATIWTKNSPKHSFLFLLKKIKNIKFYRIFTFYEDATMDKGTIPINKDFELEYRYYDKDPNFKYFNRRFEIYVLEKKTLKKNYVMHMDNANPSDMKPTVHKASTGGKNMILG